MNITKHDIVMLLILGAIVVAILVSLEMRNKNKASRINLDDLLIGEDGKASKAAFVMHGSFVVTSWVVIYQMLNKSLTDTTFGLYVAAWVAPAVTKLIKGSSPVATSETTITATTITPTQQGTTP